MSSWEAVGIAMYFGNQELEADDSSLIAREIGRDPSLIDPAKISLNRSSSERYEGYSFVSEWSALLRLPPVKVRRRLTSPDESPFVTAEGIDFSDVALRRRIWRTAKRVAVKSAALESAGARIAA
jgi:hypothetical protein